jgi:hypothetical protein
VVEAELLREVAAELQRLVAEVVLQLLVEEG